MNLILSRYGVCPLNNPEILIHPNECANYLLSSAIRTVLISQGLARMNLEMKEELRKIATSKNSHLSFKLLSAADEAQATIFARIFKGSVPGGFACRDIASDLQEHASRFTLPDTEVSIPTIADALNAAADLNDILIAIGYLGGEELITLEEVHQLVHKEVVEPLQKSIEQLKAGQRLLIRGGNMFHAVLYEVFRGDDDLFEFSIFDTSGETSDIGLEQCFKKIPTRAIQDSQFLAFLLYPQVGLDPRSGNLGFTETAMTPVYDLIKDHLQTYECKREFIGVFENQTWGTCAVSCIFAFLQKRLSRPVYQHFKAGMMISNLEKLENEASSSLFSTAFAAFARSTFDRSKATEILERYPLLTR